MGKNRGCIIVPYRDREEHLSQFIPHYRNMLPDMPIYVIEQADSKPFNRAKLLNVGFLEFGYKYDYAVYHDVDMLAAYPDAYYVYPEQPLHLATACSQFDYKLPYTGYFGGVTSISTKDMHILNGFSNNFWGYGGEDDMMYQHCIDTFGYVISYENNRYECFNHERHIDPKLHSDNVRLLRGRKREDDGLSSCFYDFLDRIDSDSYTLIKTKV